MTIEKVVIENFKSFNGKFELELRDSLNIIEGDNEAGKSTILEAINLVLTGQLNGKNINNEISPCLFNYNIVQEYITSIISKKPIPPPYIKIEVYLRNEDSLARFSGTNNSAKVNVPGFYIDIRFNEEFMLEYLEYIQHDVNKIKTLPVEYYHAVWYRFLTTLLHQEVYRSLHH